MNEINKTLQDMLDNSYFDAWFFNQLSTNMKSSRGTPLPLGTELFYRFCQDDEDKFNDLCDILERCFTDGIRVGESK